MDTSSADDRARRYRDAGWWTGETVLDRLSAVVARDPAAPAVTTPTGQLSYGELWQAATTLALPDLAERSVVLDVKNS